MYFEYVQSIQKFFRQILLISSIAVILDLIFVVAQSLAANPLLLQAVQDRLNGLVGASSGYIEK